MNIPRFVLLGVIVVLAVPVLGRSYDEALANARPRPDVTAPVQQSRIALAMSAAPPSIGRGATIIEIEPDGTTSTLREGSNGWVCWVDDPATPGDDPACLDAPWQSFFEGYVSRSEPEVDRLGISYMLRGSMTADNADPFATEPPRGQSWLKDPPHLMLIVPDPAQLEGLPTEHNARGGPYVMYKGTPYAHVMVPVPAM